MRYSVERSLFAVLCNTMELFQSIELFNICIILRYFIFIFNKMQYYRILLFNIVVTKCSFSFEN